MEVKLEVIGSPVSDVDRAKAFYAEQLGFDLDHDICPAEGMRVVQMTPAGSPKSIVFGSRMALGKPGTTKGPQLVVDDLDAVHGEPTARGMELGDILQLGPEGAPGSRFAFFSDPEGNGWSIQQR